MAIPFTDIGTTNAQVNKRDGAYVEGAEAGMIYNTGVLNEVFKGEDGITVIATTAEGMLSGNIVQRVVVM